MEPPAGTFLAKVRNGAIQFPAPLKVYCDAEGWDLFRILPGDQDRLVLEPVTATDTFDGACSSANPSRWPNKAS